MALNSLNSSNLDQLAMKGLTAATENVLIKNTQNGAKLNVSNSRLNTLGASTTVSGSEATVCQETKT